MTPRPDQLRTTFDTSCSDQRLDEASGDSATAPTTEATDEAERMPSSGSQASRSTQSAEPKTEFLPARCDGDWMGTATGPGFEFPSLLEERSQISTLGPTQAGATTSPAEPTDDAGQTALSGALDRSASVLAMQTGPPDEVWGSEAGVEPSGRFFVREAQQALRSDEAFRRWFHQRFKKDQLVRQGHRSNPDLDSSEVLEAWREWLASGRPGMK